MSLSELPEFDQNFVYEYVKDFNGTRAAERAGHQGNDNVLAVTASRLLRNAKVRAAIREILDANAMTANEVLSRLTDTARLDLSRYFIKKRGKHYINLDAIQADGLGHVVKEISYDAKGHQVVKFDDRQNALIQLGRAHGLFTDRTEHTGPEGQPLQFSEIVVTIKQDES